MEGVLLMDYSNYNVEDFASDDLFIRWVVDNDPEATLFWEAYKISNPGMAEKIEGARALLLDLQEVESGARDPEQLQKTWEQIQSRITSAPSQKWPYLLKVAASVSAIAILGFAGFLFYNEGFFGSDRVAGVVQADEQGYAEWINTTGKAVRLNLSDGSVVQLENNSRLKYFTDCTNASSRSVYLTGEAFFDIAKNYNQPFYVYANEVVTKVLGTSFRVKAYHDDESVEVSVEEGKVSVYSAKSIRMKQDTIETEVKGVMLIPNQKVYYQRAEDAFNKTLVDTPQVVKEDVLRLDFEFQNTPVKEVFEVLSEAYGVEIVFNKQGLENCYLTVPLGDEPLFDKLKIICHTIGATYQLIDANIVISSSGCKTK